MKRQMFYITLPVCVAVLLAGAWLSHAGPLAPPPGPVASTGRFSPRTEITALPTVIAVSGSYYLGGNLFGPPAGPGITITAPNVDIDLNGFELTGAGGGGVGDSAVTLGPGVSNTTIHDGTVRGWGDVGLDLVFGTNSHVYNVRALDCGGDGIRLGSFGIARNCICSGTAVGIIVDSQCKVTNCVTSDNFLNGLIAGFGSHVSDCVSTGNGSNGFLLLGECVLINSTANMNLENGVESGTSSRIANCTASDNGLGFIIGNGFWLTGDGNDLEGCVADRNLNAGFAGLGGLTNNAAKTCSASENGFGFMGTGFGFFEINRVNDCTATSNEVDGILIFGGVCINSTAKFNGFAGLFGNGILAFNSTIADCQVSDNLEDGVDATDCIVRSTTSSGNFVAGIEVTGGCHVFRNNCIGNFTDGIVATGPANNIEFNNCVGNIGAAIITLNGGGDAVLSNRETGNGAPYITEAIDSVGTIVGPGVVASAPGDHFANVSY